MLSLSPIPTFDSVWHPGGDIARLEREGWALYQSLSTHVGLLQRRRRAKVCGMIPVVKISVISAGRKPGAWPVERPNALQRVKLGQPVTGLDDGFVTFTQNLCARVSSLPLPRHPMPEQQLLRRRLVSYGVEGLGTGPRPSTFCTSSTSSTFFPFSTVLRAEEHAHGGRPSTSSTAFYTGKNGGKAFDRI